MNNPPTKPLRRFPRRIRPSFGEPMPLLKKRPQRLSRLWDVVSADELDIPAECRGWGDNAPRPMDVEWRRVCASSVFPVVSNTPNTPNTRVGSRDSLTATSEWGSGVGDSWEASTEEVTGEQADRKLAMFKRHCLNIAKASGIDEDEFIGWLTDEHTLETTIGTKLDLLEALAAEMSPSGYQYSDLTHVCYRLRHGPTQDTNVVDNETSGQKPSRLELIIRAVVELATLRDPEAVARSPEWNSRTETMAYVVDAYLDAHFTWLCVEAMENGEDCEGKFFNVPEDFEDGYRGRWWKFMTQGSEAVVGGGEEDGEDNKDDGKADQGDGDEGDEDCDLDAKCTCICW